MMNLTYPKTQRITIRIPEHLNEYLLYQSILKDMTLSDYIRRILENDMILNEREVLSKNENYKCNINNKL